MVQLCSGNDGSFHGYASSHQSFRYKKVIKERGNLVMATTYVCLDVDAIYSLEVNETEILDGLCDYHFLVYGSLLLFVKGGDHI